MNKIHPVNSRYAVSAVALLLASILTACPAGSPTPTIASITIAGAPSDSNLKMDTPVTLTATAKDSSGASIASTSFTWVSSNPDAVSVDAGGVVTAKKFGDAIITANSGAVSAATSSIKSYGLEASGRTAPQPLPYVAQTIVRVEARGALRVFVNARGVGIGAVGRVGELLVFLLEHGGSASTEVIGYALYPDAGYERARKNLWALVKLLRRALGWEGSVLALRGAYQLDPSVTWEYDVSEARTRGNFKGEFLSGVYSEWALEIGRGLQELRGRRRSDLEMN